MEVGEALVCFLPPVVAQTARRAVDEQQRVQPLVQHELDLRIQLGEGFRAIHAWLVDGLELVPVDRLADGADSRRAELSGDPLVHGMDIHAQIGLGADRPARDHVLLRLWPVAKLGKLGLVLLLHFAPIGVAENRQHGEGHEE